ncbi:MAG: NYN domain-containing protein [Pseudomonadota bacterium]
MRVFVYVDGFNLFYRALKKTPYKWLNLRALAADLLDPTDRVESIRYFTARVSGARDPDQPRRQRIYLNALKTIPGVTIHFGHFQTKTKWRPLVKPVPGAPRYVEIHDTEEKGSDVNLATYLVHDGWKNRYDAALVMSQDTDLVEPIRIVRQELNKIVGLVWLDGRQPGGKAGCRRFICPANHPRVLPRPNFRIRSRNRTAN